MDDYFGVFLVTLAGPYAILSVLLIISLCGRGTRAERYGRALIDVIWCTLSAMAVNLLFIDTPYRIGLFVVVTLGAVAFGRVFDRAARP